MYSVEFYYYMLEISKLLADAERGINSLAVGDEYKRSAINNLKEWLSGKKEFEEYKKQIAAWIEEKKWELLLDSFFQIIPFGTGGRRGLMGIGPNRINPWTIRNSAQGHAQYLLKKDKDFYSKGIVIAYGVRQFQDNPDFDPKLGSPLVGMTAWDLAKIATEVYVANGIRVFIFRSYKATPELSFAIRYLKSAGGIMIDASHNPPTDCGKKVFDSTGGQLIPPFDQELTDEVTKNVKEIKLIDFGEAQKQGLIEYIDNSLSEAYYETVAKLSLSDKRKVNIVYTPLHGPGITSVYPVLQKAGFSILLDPKTKNLSGKFENVKFNIPNPEVEQSFDNILSFADKKKADIILNSDPDADRIGIMVKHDSKWRFVNGNEIAIMLVSYLMEKKARPDDVIIKTIVTTNLISKIAEANSVKCIGDLLVGFKYIGDEMNKLEGSGKIDRFLMACEESHGYISGGYARDKDAAIAALWLSEIAAEQKSRRKTMIDYLDEIYCRYGYCRNYLTEIRILGADGLEKIGKMQISLREKKPKIFGEFVVERIDDFYDGSPFLSETDRTSRNVLVFHFKEYKNKIIKLTVRPSGTEPKIKFYIEIICQPAKLNELFKVKKEAEQIRSKIEKSFMDYCYKAIDVDFPERGYLLFNQLPLKYKLQYFTIESELAEIKNISPKEKRMKSLSELLKFLGSDPIEKVNEAFAAKYGKSIKEYLKI